MLRDVESLSWGEVHAIVFLFFLLFDDDNDLLVFFSFSVTLLCSVQPSYVAVLLDAVMPRGFVN